MFRRRCVHECGCWGRRRHRRTTRTMPCRQRSPGCVIAGLRAVGVDDHTAVLRLLADRHHDLTALRTQAACRLHVMFRELTAGWRTAADQRSSGTASCSTHRPGDLVDDGTQTARRSSTSPTSPPRSRHQRGQATHHGRSRCVGHDAARAPRRRAGRRRDHARPRRRHHAGSRPVPSSPATTAPHRSKRRAPTGTAPR